LEALTKPEQDRRRPVCAEKKPTTAIQSTAKRLNEELQTFLNILAIRNTNTEDLPEAVPWPTQS
jgi:hypothetical protein